MYEALPGNAGWMAWNLMLALVPAGLAAALFRSKAPRTPAWWLGTFAFVAFLPNAAYVLTDVVHLPRDLRAANGSELATAGVLGAYAAFIGVGFAAYAFSVIRLGAYLRGAGVSGLAAGTIEVALHSLSTAGVALGRVLRFNSWDLLTRPSEVAGALHIPESERVVIGSAAIFFTLFAGTVMIRAALRVVRAPHPY